MFRLICAVFGILLIEMSAAGTIAPTSNAARNYFAADLVRTISGNNLEKNVIYSPASIQSALVLLFVGAEGETDKELRTALKLGGADKLNIVSNYGQFLNKQFGKKSDNGPVLQTATMYYVNDHLNIVPKFNEISKKYLSSQAEKLNFNDSSKAVKTINQWVEKQTENKIQNLLSRGSVGADTSSILVNAIYFKGKWKTPFTPELTSQTEFNTRNGQKIMVPMMRQEDHFRYADLKELDAQVLELPYANSDLSMMIILPKTIDGLQALETKLAKVDLNEISHKLRSDDVFVSLPKFKIEFDIDLKEPLIQLGVQQIFGDKANLSGLFLDGGPQKVSEAKHKAYLDVNEAGSEAAAATYLKIVPMSMNLEQKIFTADHPFAFAIRNNDGVYFSGHVINA